MKFVALLSGGKDSCFNIEKCISYGHELVCLANLCPPIENSIEMNSFMYQSAAHNLIPLQAECFGVPLVRKSILGKSYVQTLDYMTPTNEFDEVEDMFELLEEVKSKFPDIKAVSCGAILSTYQRHRVEHVCNRLNLVQLTYLWQRNQKNLLDEMISCNIEAILVKVAGAGLIPHKHLGKSLREMRVTLENLNKRFQLDLCGEGGEYESLVLDCNLFPKKRIEIRESHIYYDPEDESVGNLVITGAKVVCKVCGSDSLSCSCICMQDISAATEHAVLTSSPESIIPPPPPALVTQTTWTTPRSPFPGMESLKCLHGLYACVYIYIYICGKSVLS